MKDIRINGKLQRVFVLTESDSRYVYIPLKHLTRVDYTRLLDIENKGGDMLTEMKKTKLDNGRNALAQYDSIIQVAIKETEKTGSRLPKPDEPESYTVSSELREKPAPTQSEPEKPKKRRGRPPKQAPKEEDTSSE